MNNPNSRTLRRGKSLPTPSLLTTSVRKQILTCRRGGFRVDDEYLKGGPLPVTLPKTNIAPTNGWLEYYFPIGEAYFQGLR